MCHQVHLAVRSLPQLPDVFVLFGYVCCRQRGDGQGLHVLHWHPSTVAHFGRRGAPTAAHPSWPRWRKRQARLDAVGQTKWGREKKRKNSASGQVLFRCNDVNFMQVCVYDHMLFGVFISIGRRPYIFACTLCPRGWLNQEGFNRP